MMIRMAVLLQRHERTKFVEVHTFVTIFIDCGDQVQGFFLGDFFSQKRQDVHQFLAVNIATAISIKHLKHLTQIFSLFRGEVVSETGVSLVSSLVILNQSNLGFSGVELHHLQHGQQLQGLSCVHITQHFRNHFLLSHFFDVRSDNQVDNGTGHAKTSNNKNGDKAKNKENGASSNIKIVRIIKSRTKMNASKSNVKRQHDQNQAE
mmetsp:Transcript_23302/g.36340  ORF Transcript_23302/g.36340 Transcript_23302/m.36340 type:complete len:206 (+) Transcript_23302:285-902(+)